MLPDFISCMMYSEEGHDGDGEIFVGVGGEDGSANEEEVFHVPRLAEGVAHGVFGGGSHAGGAGFVDDFARIVDGLNGGARGGRAAHFGEDSGEGFLHVLDLIELVVGPFPVESENGDAPLVETVGIDFAVAVFVGNHFTAISGTEGGTIVAAGTAHEILAIGGGGCGIEDAECAHAGHLAGVAKLDVVSAREVEFVVFPVIPPWSVDMVAARAVFVVGGEAFESGNVGTEVAAYGIDEVFSNMA